MTTVVQAINGEPRAEDERKQLYAALWKPRRSGAHRDADKWNNMEQQRGELENLTELLPTRCMSA